MPDEYSLRLQLAYNLAEKVRGGAILSEEAAKDNARLIYDLAYILSEGRDGQES